MPSRPRHVWNRMTRKRRTGLTLIRRRNKRQVERLSSLANVSDGIRNAEKISAVKDRVEGEMHVKEAEVSQGGVHVDALVSKGMGGAANVADMVDNKTRRIKAEGNGNCGAGRPGFGPWGQSGKEPWRQHGCAGGEPKRMIR